mmetsp:Transcript_18600/g.40940  ORF Transcript_18600/g.40940 Transcript_18600/m.40940 type:complete len:225 (+) Transcript_18600:54-728(+)
MGFAKIHCNIDEAYFQAVPAKQAAPSWSIPRAPKDAAKKVHISHKHQLDVLGIDSPGPGAYMPRRQRKSRTCSFGTAGRPCSAPASRACARDLLAMISGDKPEADDYLPRSSRPTIDRASRNVIVAQPDLLGAGLGKDSPGPRYSPELRSYKTCSPGYSIGQKTPGLQSQTSAKVGPGSYPVHRPEHLRSRSTSRSGPRFSMPRAERWPRPRSLPRPSSAPAWR